MSYILEALRRSQQERELGNVPSLETEAYVEPVESSGINPWIAAALALAALAVVIAIYAALQARSADPVPMRAGSGSAETAEPSRGNAPWSPSERLRELDDTGPPPDLSAGRERPVPPLISDGAGAQGGMEPMATSAPPAPRPPLEEAPLVAPPPPKPRPEPRVTRPAPRPAPSSGGLDVPDDVLRDIETFKEELRIEQAVELGSPVPKQATPKDPRDLRLPPEIALRLPAFVMTVHVHEKERERRFVVINARKYRQGATTREGLVVENILPDGAVLSYEGHRFYSPR